MKPTTRSESILKYSVYCLLFFVCVNSNAQNISGIINAYAKVNAIDSSGCPVNLTLDSVSKYTIGDTVLLIQMKGAIIDTTNSSSFGTILDYKNAGNYEFNIIAEINGNVVGLKYGLLKSYDPSGLVQLVRVPYYNNVTVTATLTAQPWNGNTGGVLVFQAAGTVTLNADIDVTNEGFKGGLASLEDSAPEKTDASYFYPITSALGGQKGESIAIVSSSKAVGRGADANGGGGANEWNNGGGGGANYAPGGMGGLRNPAYPVAFGGYKLNYSNVLNKIFLGGGGGGAHQDNNEGTNGTNGGGIIIIGANTLIGNGNAIKTNANAPPTVGSGDGAGGGGAGGTILLNSSTYNTALTIEANGGNGGNVPADSYGAGGGGSGGTIWTSSPLPVNVTTVTNGGAAGIWTSDGTVNGQAGQAGGLITGLKLQQSLFSAYGGTKAGTGQVVCQGSVAPLNVSGGISYVWSPSVYLSSSTGASVIASPTALGVYNYAVTVTDTNGCISTDTLSVRVVGFPGITACCNSTITSGQNDTIRVNPVLNTSVKWTPAAGLSCNTCTNPVAGPTITTLYYVTVESTNGCQSEDSVLVTVKEKCSGDVFIPDAFSPNNDTRNDIFYLNISNSGCIQTMNFQIFDRWGNNVFESTDLNSGWDGKYKGKELNEAVFIYQLQATLTDGTSINKKGNISLIK